MKRFIIFSLIALFSHHFLMSKETSIRTLNELIEYAQKDNVSVKMKPGTYTFNNPTRAIAVLLPTFVNGKAGKSYPIHSFLYFSGNNSSYDLTGVIFNIDTKLHAEVKSNHLFEVFVRGNNNQITGLSVVDIGNEVPFKSAIMLHVMGDNNTLSNVSLSINGSTPYGYGHHLGKGGAESFTSLRKHSSLLISGRNTCLLGCNVYTQGYGHGIVMQEAVNTYIENCKVVGKMRATDEILAEKSGVAFDLGFASNYPPGTIQPNKMIALSEDGVRTYPSGRFFGRKTEGVTVVNTTVKNMRSGFDMSVNLPPTLLIGCTAIGCQEKGYSIGSEGVIINSKGDALYGPLLTFQRNDVMNCRIDLQLMDTTSTYSVQRLCEINGTGHKIKLTNYQNKKRNIETPIVFGESFWSDAHRYRQPTTDPKEFSGAYNVELINETEMPVVFTELSSGNKVTGNSKLIENKGKNNRINEQNITSKADTICVLNKGVGGNSSSDLLARIDVDVIPYKPELVIMMVGTNDFLNTNKLTSYDNYSANLKTLISKLKQANIEVLLMSSIPADSLYLFERHRKELFLSSPFVLMQKVSRIAKQTTLESGIYFLDLFQLFYDRNIPLHNKDIYIKNIKNSGRGDGVHPTQQGYELIANMIFAYMSEKGIARKYKKILCFGDSITFGGGGDKSYPAYLSALLNPAK